ncbi:hypothetical protein BB559_001515 [Furculomyces boomerangus]|uniref:Uncharacterized protein n=1 Tax=Furculomyces boomerangus TaxID=61424 RepID=A0A2T9Z1N4_9FUNG|nr:hypothetical protein BB559_007524 [Furculomyces boomerangus]PVU98505.1 hypothetical protein BB559_001515 [Furculomyces boomerangus]
MEKNTEKKSTSLARSVTAKTKELSFCIKVALAYQSEMGKIGNELVNIRLEQLKDLKEKLEAALEEKAEIEAVKLGKVLKKVEDQVVRIEGISEFLKRCGEGNSMEEIVLQTFSAKRIGELAQDISKTMREEIEGLKRQSVQLCGTKTEKHSVIDSTEGLILVSYWMHWADSVTVFTGGPSKIALKLKQVGELLNEETS